MPKFKRRAGSIKAEQWNPGDPEADARLGITVQPGAKMGHLPRARGRSVVMPGDWIVEDEDGNVASWPDAEFRKKFDPADG